MISEKSKFSTFDAFDDFINCSFDELCAYENIFRNQISVENQIAFVIKTEKMWVTFFDNITAKPLFACDSNTMLPKIFGRCNKFHRQKLEEINIATTSFELNFKGPEYITFRDIAREDIYYLLLCITAKIANIEAMVEDLNSSIKEMKKNVHDSPMENLATVMVKHLDLLEGIETKILWLKEEAQKTVFLEMLAMKNFNLKLRSC
ncbi:hypothetical protein HHI36_008538 [Cryptolaemus montrouzieri]|uniref:Uncharacterized protein n=1 Tax=Cryptolaemus montrouzieri TaxID=559131 RepID=A0ABD2MSP7_9CUCU